MGWLFNALYALAALAAAPWLIWRRIRRGRTFVGPIEKLTGRVPFAPATKQRVWLHGVSVGEINLIAQWLPRLRAVMPDAHCVVSTTTASGRQLADAKFGSAHTCFFPFDFTWSVRRALSRIRPSLIVLAELEVWPNLLRLAWRHGIPVAIINGRLSDESYARYRRWRWLLSGCFRRVTFVAAQNSTSAERFVRLGVPAERVAVSGNLKFDGACCDRNNLRTRGLEAWLAGSSDQVVWLAGSTQEPEERLAAEAYLALRGDYPNLRLIVAPRHPERCHAVAAEMRAKGLRIVRRTELNQLGRLPADAVLLIDTIGELGAWWGLSQIAYVGGSMGDRGGQNMIEPAAYGCAVSFGPNTKNFRDVVELLLGQEAAVVVRDRAELQSFVRRSLAEPLWRAALGERARCLVASQAGAADRTAAAIATLMRESSPRARSAA
jgi:3-deoxy-D-manno-octulosonic-acid transferase